MSSVTDRARPSAALQDQLEDDLRADVGKEERYETREGPAHGLAAAPAAEVMTPQQAAEDRHRNEREHRLVVRLEGLAEELLREEHAAHDGEREHHERGQQDAEEKCFHLEQRQQRAQQGRKRSAMKPLLL